MFEYFPGNYVWNLGVVATLNSGGLIDEVDRACRPISEAAAQGEDAGTPDFLRAWRALTDQLVDQAEDAEKAGHELTAGQLYFRATNYLCQAERMLSNADPQRIPTYRRVLELAQKSFDLRDPRVTRVADPVRGHHAAGLLQRRPGHRRRSRAGHRPGQRSGLDQGAHVLAPSHWAELAARGISCLMLDQPGTGEALRLQGLTARIDTEAWAGAAVDFLRDPRRRRRRPGSASSAGRSAATTRRGPPRSRSASPSCVAWGANHNWGAVQRRRLEREGERPVPHYWEHVLWVWGHDRPRRVHRLRRRRPPRRRRRADHRSVPHRPRRERPADPARPTPTAPTSRRPTAPSASCGSSPHEEGATEHIGLDHLPYVSTFIADWVADTFAEMSSR